MNITSRACPSGDARIHWLAGRWLGNRQSPTTALQAGHDIAIESATEQHDESHFKKKTKSGLMSSGGVGFTIGSRMQSTDQKTDGNTTAASTIGSTEGNVLMEAGHAYRQVGSDVITPQGSIGITAESVDIEEARERSRTTVETKFKQSGLTVAITSPVISAIQTAQQMSEAASDTKDTRMKVLAAANTGFAAYNAYKAVDAGQGTTIAGVDGQIQTGTNYEGAPITHDDTAAEKAGGVNISIRESNGPGSNLLRINLISAGSIPRSLRRGALFFPPPTSQQPRQTAFYKHPCLACR